MSWWWIRHSILSLGDQVATSKPEVQQYAITGDSEDFAQELLLWGRVMGRGGHPNGASLLLWPPPF